MSLTLQQLRQRTLDYLRETSSDGHFTQDQLTGYLNDAQEYVALISSPPEDRVSVATQFNIGAYPLPSDNLIITTAFFGNEDVHSDLKKLTILSKINASHMFPAWMDATDENTGTPGYLWYLDNTKIYLHPRPNAENAGKRIYMYYGFSPTLMTADGDVPSVKNNFQFLLPKLACRDAYYALSNPVMAKEMYQAFMQDMALVKDTIEKEAEELFAFKWGVSEQ